MAFPPPPVYWAQRSGILFVTIGLEDCKNPDIKVLKDKISFSGTGGTEKKHYQVEFELYKPINPEASKTAVMDRTIELVLKKEEDNAPYWPRLTKDKNKHHWLKVNFAKWKDEDDSEDEVEDDSNFEDMMRSMGGLNSSDDGDKPNFDDLPNKSDSEEEEMPDLE